MATAEKSLFTSPRHNVANPERWVSVVAGSALAAYGLTRRTVSGFVLAALGGTLIHRGATGHCMLYEALGVSTVREEQKRHVSVPYGKGFRVEKSVTIDTTPEQMYAFWRNFENLPRFMDHLQSVEVLGPTRSHWQTKGPAGTNAQWEAEIINEIPNELIGWRSVDGSNVNNAGSVHFEPGTGGSGTVVKVVLRYDPPGGAIGAAFAKLFGEDPARQVQEDLRRLKQIVETGKDERAVEG